MFVNIKTDYYSKISRLVSTYEDKVLGLTENGLRWWQTKHYTFPAFITHILSEWTNKQTANEHWRPYYVNCDYCDIKYDFIGRVENFEYDFNYIAKKANISLKNLPENSIHYHASGSHKSYSAPIKVSKKDKDKKVINYFSQLHAGQLKGLYNMYKVDFEMFDYKLYPYVKPYQME